MMNVLFACPPSRNPFISNLILALTSASSDTDVHLGAKLFWNLDRPYQILQLHWIESLCKSWRLNSDNSKRIAARIKEFQLRGTKVCLTRHNIKPHNQNANEDHYLPILELVDAVVHMGDSSMQEFSQRYGRFGWQQSLVHRVISHPNYSTTPNYLNRTECRHLLGLPNDKKVLLVFGGVRSRTEAEFCAEVLKRTSSDFIFVCPKWRSDIQGFGARFRRKWITQPRDFGCMVTNQFVNEEEVQFYLNSADLVFLPRIGDSNLNSGIVPLAFTFGKVVIGPDHGVIGEVLKSTKNPVFPSGDVRVAASLIDQFFSSEIHPQEIANRSYSNNEMGLDRVGRDYLALYRQLVEKRDGKSLA